jgi:hypothetical protein
MKNEKSAVTKQFFCNEEASQISAVLASPARPGEYGGFIAVHNPYARNPLPIGKSGADVEYFREDRGKYF